MIQNTGNIFVFAVFEYFHDGDAFFSLRFSHRVRQNFDPFFQDFLVDVTFCSQKIAAKIKYSFIGLSIQTEYFDMIE